MDLRRMCAYPLVPLTFLCMVLFLPAQLTAMKLERDWETIPSKDVGVDFIFSQSGQPFFRILNKIGDDVYIGGNETLLKLSYDNDEVVVKYAQLKTNEPDLIVSCDVQNVGDHETVCWNFIRVAEMTSLGELFVCGTNAYSGLCYKCSADLQDCTPLDGSSQLPLVPKSPYTNPATARFDRNSIEDVLYTTSIDEQTVARYQISVPSLNITSELDSVTVGGRFIKAPRFVGKPFNYTDSSGKSYVLFFYRETALEYDTFGQKQYSRIARVCESDPGGTVNTDKFVTFVKARLNCSIPDDLLPFYYDEIQDVIWDDNDNEAYAVFTSQSLGPKSSALCRFRMEDIMKLFDEGDSKDQVNGEANREWLPVNVVSPRPGTCNEVHTTEYPPLMDKLVPNYNPFEATAGLQMTPPDNFNVSDTPTLYVDGVRFTSLAIDFVNSVFFFGTSEGTVIKSVRSSSGQFNNTVEINELVTSGPITGLELMESISGFKNLVITTDTDVITWPLTQCSARSSLECETVRYPYCKWEDSACICGDSTSNCEYVPPKVLKQPAIESVTSCDYLDIYLYCEADAGPFFDGSYDLSWTKDNDDSFFSSSSHLAETTRLSDKLLELRVTVHSNSAGVYNCTAKVGTTTETKLVEVILRSCLTEKSLKLRCDEYTRLKEARDNIVNNDGTCSVDVEECSTCRLGSVP